VGIATELSQYAAARTVAALFSPFDPEQNLETARMVARIYARFGARRRERACLGVQRAFPSMPAELQRRIVETSIGHMFGIFMVDAFAMPRVIGHENWHERVQLGNVGRAMEHLTSPKPCIFVTGHVGNWEILGYVLALVGFEMTALARPFIADQNAGPDGLFVPFFSRLASTYKSIPLLALRYELPVVCGYARRVDGAFRYELRVTDVIEPSDWRDADDPILYIGARFNRALEWMIRESPEQYLWVHRRWNSRPKHERAGDPMPERLSRKLAALPWMTPNLLAELAKPIDAPVDPAAMNVRGAPRAIDPQYRFE
jgi:KDO2-lipid IV(A) lauroyltransferase